MVLNLQQLQKQTQRLIMTPQMQQSIQLLQLNAIELEQMAQQELLENPFLTLEEEAPAAAPERSEEAGDGPADRLDEPAGDIAPGTDWDGAGLSEARGEDYIADFSSSGDFPSNGDGLNAESGNGAEPGEHDSSGDGPSGSLDESSSDPPTLEAAPEQFDQVDLNWDDYYSDAENSAYIGTHEETEERDFSEYVAAKTSLSDHLNWQLRCCVLDAEDTEIGGYIIGSLNEDGYLPPEIIQDVVETFQVEPARAERVLSVLQEFDPPGICARSLPESLLLQMKQLGSWSELARTVLENHLVEFQKKKFRELARIVGVEEEALNVLYHKVCRLEPHPGRSLSVDSVQYIQPDIYVKLIDGELIIYLNEGQAGRLSVDRFYHRLMLQQAAAVTQKDREYALEKYRSALTLIKNIEKRKSTILRVTESIMEVQRGFLERGVEALRPLTLREVADMVGMHESTVARVTSRKYVETPQGTYPLKYFFSSSIDSLGADAVSSRSIKDKLEAIIGSENDKRPLSDQKIAEMLNKQGFDIARRTVAKYREQLKILPAKYRRQT